MDGWIAKHSFFILTLLTCSHWIYLAICKTNLSGAIYVIGLSLWSFTWAFPRENVHYVIWHIGKTPIMTMWISALHTWPLAIDSRGVSDCQPFTQWKSIIRWTKQLFYTCWAGTLFTDYLYWLSLNKLLACQGKYFLKLKKPNRFSFPSFQGEMVQKKSKISLKLPPNVVPDNTHVCVPGDAGKVNWRVLPNDLCV